MRGGFRGGMRGGPPRPFGGGVQLGPQAPRGTFLFLQRCMIMFAHEIDPLSPASSSQASGFPSPSKCPYRAPQPTASL